MSVSKPNRDYFPKYRFEVNLQIGVKLKSLKVRISETTLIYLHLSNKISGLFPYGEIQLDVPFIKGKKYRHPFYKKKWVVFAKHPVLAGEKTLEYLGRYVHKMAIGNSRLKSIDEKNVTFSWFDYKSSAHTSS